MPRPVVLVAWEPASPEEALAVQERLEPIADVEWEHALSPDLRADLLPRIDALLLAKWPPWLDRDGRRMERLRYVACVPRTVDFVRMIAFDDLPQPPIVEAGIGALGPADPSVSTRSPAHVEPVKEAAERVAEFLRRQPFSAPPAAGVTGAAS